MNRKSLGITVLTVLLLTLALSVTLTNAQYVTEESSEVTVGSSGTATVIQETTGVTINVTAPPGATGTVNVATYLENPEPQATPPPEATFNEDTTYVVISFEDLSGGFESASVSITVPYSGNVGGVYKLVDGNYIAFSNYVVNNDNTVTITLTSPTDPLFAIAAPAAVTEPSAIPTWAWAAITVVVVVIVIATALFLKRSRA